ncbi:sugar-binding domain-containing protein [Mangrovimonas futianensis]|uniref:sugar-binding domain-containing protein n=1 Tax=Mangrovimonas futianensis TaxID=2895523 RepID=UPI001E2DB7E9|nr:sugar-binding domain-containing protein [Mangrovimonas futianensis]MCF1422917.1 DUF4982 domain-containing protein [Mangrovimonas futianensis]
MKSINILPAFAIVCLFLLALTPSAAQVSFGNPELINNSWLFQLGDIPDASSHSLDDSKWQAVDLPHDWSVQAPLSPSLASATGYLPGGIGWYRKHLSIPTEKSGDKVYLYFEGIYNRSEIFVNGQSLGKHPNGYVSFLLDATPYIRYGQDNLISVRVDHSQSVDSRWYTGSGIYRDAWVVYANPIHIAEWGVYAYPEKQNKNYQLQVEVALTNDTDNNQEVQVEHELLSPEGSVVATSSKSMSVEAHANSQIQTSLKVKRPELWSIDSPNLYTLRTRVLKGSEVLDETITTTGFRDFTFDANRGFALNGEWMKIKGVCLHHDGGVLGAAVPRAVWKRRLLTLKELGVNAIRTSHNPQAPDLYELCDELGLLVLDEAFDEWEYPKRKWIEGWNVGTPGYQGSYDFFDEWAEKDLANMIKRDRNHPSIFAWSIGNEVDYPNDPYSHPVLDGGEKTGFTQPIFGGYKKDAPDAKRLGDIAKRLVEVVKTYDRSRPTTAGLAGVAMSNQTEYPFALDITGYNYTESLYDHDHEAYPNRVIFGSENGHDYSAWEAVTSRDFVFGQFLWTGIDYLGESGSWPSRGFYSGLLDFGGFIKPRGFFRQSLWSDQPMAYLGTYPTPGKGSKNQAEDVWSQLDADNEDYEETTPSKDAWAIWNYSEGQLIRVVCYTNAAQAELYLNDELVGERKSYDSTNGIIYWDIPYTKGKLEVLGLDQEGNTISQDAIVSSDRPEALKIISEIPDNLEPGDVAQIILQVVDKDGVPVMLSDNEVTCSITGDAFLLGLEASNNKDMSDYTDNKHRVYHGRLIAYVKLGSDPKDVIVRFSSPWLKPTEVKIK